MLIRRLLENFLLPNGDILFSRIFPWRLSMLLLRDRNLCLSTLGVLLGDSSTLGQRLLVLSACLLCLCDVLCAGGMDGSLIEVADGDSRHIKSGFWLRLMRLRLGGLLLLLRLRLVHVSGATDGLIVSFVSLCSLLVSSGRSGGRGRVTLDVLILFCETEGLNVVPFSSQ